jgi:murein L,D-transpeptidase YcbB/YkuD
MQASEALCMSFASSKSPSASTLLQSVLRGAVLLLLPLALVAPASADSVLRQQAERLHDAEAPAVLDIPLFSGRLLAEFYAERDYRAAWDAERARVLLKLARQSRDDGFEPDDFHATAIARLIESGQLETVLASEKVDGSGARPEVGSGAGSEAALASGTETGLEIEIVTHAHSDADARMARADADLLLSDALLRYVHHFRFGKYNPRHINRDWIFVDKADADGLKADMALVLAAPDLDSELAALLPSPSFYRHLKKGYRRYLDIADHGGWQVIPGGVNLSVGMRDPRVSLIRERLAVTDGFQSGSLADPDVYDQTLADAVKGFQQRSGLSPDAVIGPNTLRALNHPLDDRLLTIRANLERMRWLYNDLPADYLFVDVAAFRLHLIRNNEEVWNTRVVIGTPEDQTPMFRDELEHIVFNPTWSVPVSIQKKMGGVSSRYEVIDRRTGRKVSGVNASDYKRYRIVQPAGPSNALGQVKFMFPNGHAIYLHDTPSKHLFSRSSRAYSHGCIRVQNPLTLAEQVLNKPNWGQAEINRVVKRGSTRYVHLDEHLPVLLYYLTALADDQGRVGFRRDVYKRDQRLFAVLDQPAHGNRIAFREPPIENGPETDPSNGLESESAKGPDIERESAPEIGLESGPDARPESDAITLPDADPDALSAKSATAAASTATDDAEAVPVRADATDAAAGASSVESATDAESTRLILDEEGRRDSPLSQGARLAFDFQTGVPGAALGRTMDRIPMDRAPMANSLPNAPSAVPVLRVPVPAAWTLSGERAELR